MAWGSGANALVSDGRRVVRLEIATTRTHVTDDPALEGFTISNHYLSSEMADLSPTTPPEDTSSVRQARMAALLAEHHGQINVESGKAFLRDHQSGPSDFSICRHDDPRQTGTIYAIVTEPLQGKVWIAFGRPCAAEYVSFGL